MSTCVSHHHACECREEEFKKLESRVKELEEKLKSAQVYVHRYKRLQILGCAPMGSVHLQLGTVLRFSGLDDFLDEDLRLYRSRGEFEDKERE